MASFFTGLRFIAANPALVLGYLGEHLAIIAQALLLGVAIALPVGVFAARRRALAAPLLGILGLLYTIPSLALMILLLPLFGLNARTVIAALVIYNQTLLIRNIVGGLHGLDPALLEAANGLGMTGWQRWWRVELPLALPVMLAGLRIAAVVDVAVATLGAKLGAGGLGRLLFDGIAQGERYDKIWAGTIGVALLAFALNWGFGWLERFSRLQSGRR